MFRWLVPHALPWDALKVNFEPDRSLENRIDRTRTRSQARQLQLEEFAWLRAVADLQRRNVDEDVSLNLETRRRLRATRTTQWEQLELQSQRLAADGLEMQWIDLPEQPTKAHREEYSKRGTSQVDIALRESLRVVADLAAN